LALVGSQPTEDLIVSCVDEADGVATGLICSYLSYVRAPDPNERVSADPMQTALGFMVAGHRSDNPRSQALLEELIGRGVKWDQPHDRGLTPLHLAVVAGSEALVKRFPVEGASASVTLNAPDQPIDGMSALALASFAREKAEQQGDHEAVKVLSRIVLRGC